MLLFYINSILMFYPKICFRKQEYQKEFYKYYCMTGAEFKKYFIVNVMGRDKKIQEGFDIEDVEIFSEWCEKIKRQDLVPIANNKETTGLQSKYYLMDNFVSMDPLGSARPKFVAEEYPQVYSSKNDLQFSEAFSGNVYKARNHILHADDEILVRFILNKDIVTQVARFKEEIDYSVGKLGVDFNKFGSKMFRNIGMKLLIFDASMSGASNKDIFLFFEDKKKEVGIEEYERDICRLMGGKKKRSWSIDESFISKKRAKMEAWYSEYFHSFLDHLSYYIDDK